MIVCNVLLWSRRQLPSAAVTSPQSNIQAAQGVLPGSAHCHSVIALAYGWQR